MPRLLVVDLMPLLYRGHFAMIRRPRMTSGGLNVSALHFFVSTLADLAKSRGATHAALVMDTSPTFRHGLYPGYKAQREKMPEDIAAAIEPARRFAAAMRIPVLSSPGFEADDVAGTLAAMADAAGWEAWIVSPDKDMAQLVTERVSLVRPSHVPGEKDDVYDPARVCAEWGLSEPAQMVDWLGMAGDAADNIPGFPGIGPKKASELIAKFGSVRGVVDHASEIPGKTGETVAANAETAFLSRRLAEIRRDVPLGVALDDLALRPFDEAALEPLFAKYEMFALSRRVLGDRGGGGKTDDGTPPAAAAGPPAAAATPGATAENASPAADRPLKPAPPVERRVADTPEGVAALAAELEGASRFAFSADGRGVAIATSPETHWWVPVGGREPDTPPLFADMPLFAGRKDAAPSGAALPRPPTRETAPVAPPQADDLFSFFAAQAAQGTAEPSPQAGSAPSPQAAQGGSAPSPQAAQGGSAPSPQAAQGGSAPSPQAAQGGSAPLPQAAQGGSGGFPPVLCTLPPRIAAVFADPSKTKTGHDLKPSLRALRRLGVEAVGPFEDTMLAHYVLDPARRHYLDAVVREVLGEECDPGPKNGKENAADAGAPDAGEADPRRPSPATVLRLGDALASRIDAAGAGRAWREAENPLVPVLLDMEDAGVRIDTAALSRLSVSLGAELAGIGERIFSLAGEPFNIDSPKQLGAILFDKLHLPAPGKKTASGHHSTAEEVLQGVAGAHPIVREVLEWRAVSKLKSTYVDKLPQCVSPADGRVHTTFQQALTETGRLSSDNPNLQNIPVRTERGKPIRAAFVPEPGCVLVSADYSQVELRVMASLSGDEALLEAFGRGEDIHAATAARVFGIPVAEVTREQRSRCKQVSFGILYGISAFGLSQRLGISRQDSDGLIKTWFEAHPGVKRWIEETKARARTDGFVTTLLGRRRPLRDIASRNATIRAAAERIAVNTPVQGTAADIAKLAMVRVHAALRARGLATRLVLQIHDELLLEAPEREVAEVSALVRDAMENALPLPVPLVVDVGTGSNWLEAH